NLNVSDRSAAATSNTDTAPTRGSSDRDTVTLNTAGAIGTFASKDVANNIVVTISGLTLGGAQAADYVITPPTTTANITAKVLTMTDINANNKHYHVTPTSPIKPDTATH